MGRRGVTHLVRVLVHLGRPWVTHGLKVMFFGSLIILSVKL